MLYHLKMLETSFDSSHFIRWTGIDPSLLWVVYYPGVNTAHGFNMCNPARFWCETVVFLDPLCHLFVGCHNLYYSLFHLSRGSKLVDTLTLLPIFW